MLSIAPIPPIPLPVRLLVSPPPKNPQLWIEVPEGYCQIVNLICQLHVAYIVWPVLDLLYLRFVVHVLPPRFDRIEPIPPVPLPLLPPPVILDNILPMPPPPQSIIFCTKNPIIALSYLIEIIIAHNHYIEWRILKVKEHGIHPLPLLSTSYIHAYQTIIIAPPQNQKKKRNEKLSNTYYNRVFIRHL